MYKPQEVVSLRYRKMTLSVSHVRPGFWMAYEGCIDGVPNVVASNKALTMGRLLRVAFALSRDVR